jgi:hypothetical protein
VTPLCHDWGGCVPAGLEVRPAQGPAADFLSRACACSWRPGGLGGRPMGDTMCGHCGVKPRWNGQPFCSGACASAAAAAPTAPRCRHCQVRPAWNGQPYCSKDCDDAAKATPAPPTPISAAHTAPGSMVQVQCPPGVGPGMVVAVQLQAGVAALQVVVPPGITAGMPFFVQVPAPIPEGVPPAPAQPALDPPSGGATQPHLKPQDPTTWAAPPAGTCRFCRNRPSYSTHPYCGKSCASRAQAAGWAGNPPCPPGAPTPDLPEVHDDLIQVTGPKAEDIKQQFVKKWQHPDSGHKPTPTITDIVDVWQINAHGRPWAHPYRAHQTKLADRKKRHYAGKGNTLRRFHGTGQKCTLGIHGNTKCCADKTCATCNIINTGFSMTYASHGRYGRGLYSTSCSSKAHDYAAGSTSSKGFGGHVSRAFPSWNRSILTVIYLCHPCS